MKFRDRMKKLILWIGAGIALPVLAQRAGKANQVFKVPSAGGRAKFGLLSVENMTQRVIQSPTAAQNNVARNGSTITGFSASGTVTTAGLTVSRGPSVVYGKIEAVSCDHTPPSSSTLTLTITDTGGGVNQSITIPANASGSAVGGSVLGLSSSTGSVTFSLSATMTGCTSATLINPRLEVYELH